MEAPLEAPLEAPVEKRNKLPLSGEKSCGLFYIFIMVSYGLRTQISRVQVLDTSHHPTRHPMRTSWLLVLFGTCFGLEDHLHNYVNSYGFQCITLSMISYEQFCLASSDRSQMHISLETLSAKSTSRGCKQVQTKNTNISAKKHDLHTLRDSY